MRLVGTVYIEFPATDDATVPRLERAVTVLEVRSAGEFVRIVSEAAYDRFGRDVVVSTGPIAPGWR